MKWDIPIKPDKPAPDRDECVRIVQEINEWSYQNQSCIYNPIMQRFGDRILAAVEPKRWPMVLGRPNESLMVHAPDDSGTLPLAICEGTNVARADISKPNVDRLIVNLLMERGVDLELLCTRTPEGTECDHPNYQDTFDNAQEILSNARGEA